MTSVGGAQIVVNLIFGFLIIALSFLIGFRGLVKRKRYGRWIGVIGISLILVIAILSNIFRPSGPAPYYEYTNSIQAMTAAVLSIVVFCLLIFLIYRLARGKQADAFFSQQDISEPPPSPPSEKENPA